jgi:hypothetical protein
MDLHGKRRQRLEQVSWVDGLAWMDSLEGNEILTRIQVPALKLLAPLSQPCPLRNPGNNLQTTLVFANGNEPSPTVVPKIDACPSQPVQVYIVRILVTIGVYELAKEIILPKCLCHDVCDLGKF